MDNDPYPQSLDVQEVQVAAAATPQKPMVSRKVAELARKKAEEQTRATNNSETSNLKYYSELLTKSAEKIRTAGEDAQKRAEEWAEAWSLLARAGLDPQEHEWNRWRIEVAVTEKQLKKVYDAVGRLNESEMEKDIECAEKKLIKVTMPSVKYPNVRVSFVRKLTEADTCKIVEEVVPARVEHRLVCGVKHE